MTAKFTGATADWLVSFGLSEYAERFAENDIDMAVPRDLTDPDLKDLGISSLGHRRKLLRVIGELGGGPSVVAPKGLMPLVATEPARWC